MQTFMGHTVVRTDDKGRIFIPAGYRKILAEMGSRTLVMRRDTANACLIVYPEDVWSQKVETLSNALNEWDAADNMLLTQFLAEAEEAEMDGQGRVLLQKKNLQLLGAQGELLVVGMRDRFAIWDKETFEKSLMSSQEFAIRIEERMKR